MSTDPAPSDITVQLFTISDSREPDNDESGQILQSEFKRNNYTVEGHQILRENREELRDGFGRIVDNDSIDVVVSSGGTGISSRDRTLEVVEKLIDKPLPGFGELFRHLSFKEVGPYTVMSRATAGRANDTLLIALPGSPNAVKLALDEIILEILPHMVKEIRKEQ